VLAHREHRPGCRVTRGCIEHQGLRSWLCNR
jgi:hypothetical protein